MSDVVFYLSFKLAESVLDFIIPSRMIVSVVFVYVILSASYHPSVIISTPISVVFSFPVIVDRVSLTQLVSLIV